MIRKILLIFGIALCAVLMSGCFPTYSTITYWGEIHGQITDMEGNPLEGINIVAFYGASEPNHSDELGPFSNFARILTKSDQQGKFITQPLTHTYFLEYLGRPGIFPTPPYDGTFVPWSDNSLCTLVYLYIYSTEKNINYLICWSRTQNPKDEARFYISENYVSKHDPPIIELPGSFNTIRIKYMDAPQPLVFKGRNIKIYLGESLMENIKKRSYHALAYF